MARSCAQPPPAACVMIRTSKTLMLRKFYLLFSTLLAQINVSERAEDNGVLIHYRSEPSRLKQSLVYDVLQNISVCLLLLLMFIIHVLICSACSQQFLFNGTQNNTFRVVLDQNVIALHSIITIITHFVLYMDLSLLYSSRGLENIQYNTYSKIRSEDGLENIY